MKLCNAVRWGAARAPALVRSLIRKYLRLSRRERILYSPLIVLLLISAAIIILLLHYTVVCELPAIFVNAAYHRTDVNREFWPYSLSSELASSVVRNLTSNKPVSIPIINFNYARISFLKNSLPSCKSSEKYDIIILIKTSLNLKGRDQRSRLRSSWANEHALDSINARVKYAFLVGDPEQTLDNEERSEFEEEIAQYGDFIIGDFKDGYRSLIFKAMMSLRWAEEFCPNYEFLLIIDDDFELYLESLVKFLRDPQGYPYSDNAIDGKAFSKVCKDGCKDFYAGYILPHFYTPDRGKTSKMFLTREEYPPEVFPLYVTGLMIILSKKTVSSMNHLAQFMPHVSIEDVYLGLLARKLKIRPFGINSLISTSYNSQRFILDLWKSSSVTIARTEHSFGCD